jgi:hypothetical protein
MDIQWSPIPHFEWYLISSAGEVINTRLGDRQLPVHQNQQGIAVVNLGYGSNRSTRSVVLLVAKAFIEPESPAFNAPINLNGDRLDCRIENILWRPRWFARDYHKQFSELEFYRAEVGLEIVQTGERFQGWSQPSIKYGLRYGDIRQSYLNDEFVFPTRHKFRRV